MAPVVNLQCQITNNDHHTLEGTLQLAGSEPEPFTATYLENTENWYQVERPYNGKWRLGARTGQRVIAIDIQSSDGGHTFTGTMTYAGEGPIGFSGIQEMSPACEDSPSTKLLYDFTRPDLWATRAASIEDVIDITFSLFPRTITRLGGLTVREFARLAAQNEIGTAEETAVFHIGDDNTQLITLLEEENTENSELMETAFRMLSRLLQKITKQESRPTTTQWLYHISDFDLKQMLHLYLLAIKLKTFFQQAIKPLIENSLAENKRIQLPPLHLYRQTLQLTGTDAEILQQAIMQRRDVINNDGHYLAKALALTDKLALLAIAPIWERLPGQNRIVPITYFSKRTYIRQLPYSDRHILVGLGYDLVPQNTEKNIIRAKDGTEIKPAATFERMAIPHEVGHFVYTRARLEIAKGQAGTFADLSRHYFREHPYFHWCEEIFSDAYACLVAGPLAVLGMQGLLATGDKNRLWMDDEEHPTPILRPYLLTEILRLLNKNNEARYPFTNAARQLDENWTAVLHQSGFVLLGVKNGRPNRVKLPSEQHNHLEEMINIETAVETARPILEKFVAALLANTNAASWQTTSDDELSAEIPWCQQDYDGLKAYDKEMEALTDRLFAISKVPSQWTTTVTPNHPMQPGQSADDILRNMTEQWSDSGPTGHGDHPD